MTRYTVRGPIEGRIDDYYVMENDQEMTFFDQQAQAEICAWALNMVAAGKQLAATEGDFTCAVCEADAITDRYEGPTEGVAP